MSNSNSSHRSDEIKVQLHWSISTFVRSAHESLRELLTLLLVAFAGVLIGVRQERWWLTLAALLLGAIPVASSVWLMGTRDTYLFRWHRLALWCVPIACLLFLLLAFEAE
jgi:hypothetical protein